MKIKKVKVNDYFNDVIACDIEVTFENNHVIHLSQHELQALAALQNALDNDDDCYYAAVKRCARDDVAFMQTRCDVIVEVMNGRH
jgi:hypothetical protein